MNYPHLFSPYRIRNRVYRNRILSAPNGTKHKTLDGFPNEFEVTIFESRAKGGAAQVTTGADLIDVEAATARLRPWSSIIPDATQSRSSPADVCP